MTEPVEDGAAPVAGLAAMAVSPRLSVAARARLAAEIVDGYVRVRRGLRRTDLPTLIAELRGSGPRGADRPLALPGDARRLGAAVTRTLAPLPLDSRCLTRSLVLLDLLARRGAHGVLVIAVRPGEGLELAAHAWIEVDGRALLAAGGADHGRLVTL